MGISANDPSPRRRVPVSAVLSVLCLLAAGAAFWASKRLPNVDGSANMGPALALWAASGVLGFVGVLLAISALSTWAGRR